MLKTFVKIYYQYIGQNFNHLLNSKEFPFHLEYTYNASVSKKKNQPNKKDYISVSFLILKVFQLALISLRDCRQKSLEEKNCRNVELIDLSRSLGTVNHDLFLKNLCGYSFDSTLSQK